MPGSIPQVIFHEPLALHSEGDIVIGGFFPLHYVAPKPQQSYNNEPQIPPCSGFHERAFRWMITMVFAVEEINSNSSLLPGVKLGYRIMDSCNHIHNSLQALYSLLTHSEAVSKIKARQSSTCLYYSPVPAVIGLASSSPTRAVAQTLGPFNIPLVSYFATCTCLTDKHLYPSFLRTVPSDLFQVRGLVKLVTYFGWFWVGTIGTMDDYSLYGIQAFSNQFGRQGGCVAFHLSIPASPTMAEIQEMADKLESSTARVVVVITAEVDLLHLFSELAQRNVTGIQWIASEAWVTSNRLASPDFHFLLEGTLGFSFPGVSIPGLKDFLLNVRPSPKPGMEFINMFWEEQFGCKLENYAGAVEKPVCTGSEDLRQTDSSYSDVSQVRISYNVYKAVYAVAHVLHTFLNCDSVGHNRGLCEKHSSFSNGQFLQHLKMVNFTNQFNEKVYFDSNGEPVPLYDIINWQKDSKDKMRFIKVGSYDGSAPHGQQLQIMKNTIVWTKGERRVPVSQCSAPCPPGSRQATRQGEPKCCFDCLPCADGEISNQTGSTDCIKCPEYYWSDKDQVKCVEGEEEFLSFYDAMGIILVALTLLGFILTSIVTIVFHSFRYTPIVKANNSEISFLLLLSLKLCFLCCLVFIGQPSWWTCRLRQAAFGISFVLCLSCVLFKTIVVLLAFRTNIPSSRGRKLFGTAQQRILIICTTAPQICLCTGWVLAAPPFPFRNPNYQASTGRIVVECKEPWPPGFYLLLGYIGLLAFACLLLAFLGRKLPDTFNEAKLITFSMLIFWAVWISFIPAYVSSPGKFSVAVEIFAILSSSFGLLLCIFIPKCYIILLRPERNIKKGITGKYSR
ncbi:extracellular calcium-sensing receptor-like [Oreochromis niloticus]|uniref:extracellular calcium-sensing receptor-like n=1 Tax=Oreochromis niloticus TaxID=8128 RepID=UPI000905C707|nr:extracellular calcium-sensing receptor-like [Oreochromis niloticus]